jgi:MFS family permease
VLLAVALGAVVMAASMGARQSFGLFLGPLAALPGLSLSLAAFAFAFALPNLAWGLAQPFAGAAADRFGAPLVTAVGAALYAAGLLAVVLAPGPAAALLGLGVLVGLGLACTSFGTVIPAAGRAVPPGRRSAVMGLVSAVGAAGAVAIVPLAQASLDRSGAGTGLLVLAALVLASARSAWRSAPAVAAGARPLRSAARRRRLRRCPRCWGRRRATPASDC